jgi:hypothetical protein
MGFFQKLFYGVDVDEEARKGAELDAGIAAYQRKQYESGVWSASEYDRAKANADQQAASTYNDQVTAEFNKGLAEGKANVSGAIKGTINAGAGVVTTLLGGIPWYLWIGVAGLLAFKLGLLDGILKKR